MRMSEPSSQFSNDAQRGGVNMQGAHIAHVDAIISGNVYNQRQSFTPHLAPTEAQLAEAQERFARLAN